jgi:hypothetical protein
MPRTIPLSAIALASLACASTLQANPSPTDLDSLPWGTARNGSDLGPTYGGVSTLPLLTIPWGRTIAILPNEIAIGGEMTAEDDPRFNENSRGVWIFEVPSPDDPMSRYGPSHAQTLVPIPTDPSFGTPDGYGASIVGDGRWLFVSAAKTAVGGMTAAGAVHVYHRAAEGAAWQPFTILSSPAPLLDASYGTALAFDGTTLVVGVPGRKAVAGAPTTGGADLYVVGAEAIEPPVSFIAPQVGTASHAFGTRVAVSGDRFALSDPAMDAGPGNGTGMVLTVSASTLAVESTLVSPTGQRSTKFGSTLALQDDRLVVAAPLEDFGGITDRGTARAYLRTRNSWSTTHVIYGPTNDAELTNVALDGDLIAVGMPNAKHFLGGGLIAYGRASLYRLNAGSAVLLASATPAPIGASEFRSMMGSCVGLGHGRWCFTEKIETSSLESQSVRLLPTASAQSDCDGDGVSDTAEVFAGAPDADGNGAPDGCPSALQPDCDEDGNADSSQTMLVWPTPPYVGKEATWYYSGVAHAHDVAAMWIVSRAVPDGSDGIVRGVEADWVNVPGYTPQPVFVAIYDDPNQDGEPSDAVFRGAWRARVAASPGRDRVFIDPIDIGPGGTRYFVGAGAIALVPADLTLAIRDDGANGAPTSVVWQAHGANNVAAELDLIHPAQNDVFGPFPNAAALAVEGLFRPAEDANGNATPDACECAADLDGSGAVDAADLGALLGAWGSDAADLDGNGSTDGADVAALIEAWGNC